MVYDLSGVDSTNLENEEVASSEVANQKKGLVNYGIEAYTHATGILKDKAIEVRAEISEREEKLKFLRDLIQEINKLSTEKGLDASKNTDFQEKLKIAKELGINLDESKFKYSAEDRDNLKGSLSLGMENLTNEIREKTVEVNKFVQESERWLTLATTLMKAHDRAARSAIEKTR